MDLVLLLARLLLAGVFVVAGIGKLVDLPGSRRAAGEFGVPDRFAPAFSLVLPTAELVVAAALLPVATARWGALGALALLLVFIGGIGYQLARGRTPDCHCFGQIHSAPAGWPTIGRNAGLAAIALLIAVGGWSDPGSSTVAWLSDLPGTGIALVIAGLLGVAILAGLAWIAVNLISQNGRLLLRIEAVEQALATAGTAPAVAPVTAAVVSPKTLPLGLAVGTPAPAFSLPDLDGAMVSLDTLRAGGTPVLLLFTDPNCGPCNQVMREVGRWERALAGRPAIAVLSRGSHEANAAKRDEHGLSTLLIQPNRDTADAYRTQGTPAAVLIGPDGTIGAPTAGGLDAVRALVASLIRNGAATSPASAPADSSSNAALATPATPAAPLSNDAPEFQLSDLTGRQVSLSDLRAARLPVVLYFTDPQCDPCDVLMPDLGRWQRDHGDRVTVALVSRGTPEANLAKTERHGVANVLLQRDMEIIEAYGVTQAPAVVVVQPDGTRDGAPAYGDLAVRMLVARVADVPEIRPETPEPVATGPMLRIGDPVPSIQLPAIGGELADLANVRGAETVLLFWSPTCGYCLRMLNDLKAWEAQRPAGSPRLVIVSTGTAEMTAAHGLRSPVVLDHGVGVGRRFGTHGTPAAIRIDEHGNVASPVASGVTAVLGMLWAGAPAPIDPEPTATVVAANGHGALPTASRN